MNDEFEEYMPEPPDGGWGWVVMIASFLNNFILDGIAYCFGVFLNEYAWEFQQTIGATSLANSLLCGVYLSIGPIVGALVNKFGCRPVGIAGSLTAAIAFIISTFSPNILVFQITYGFLGGVGFGLMYLPAVVGVGFYFEKKRAIATGIAVCGTGIGTFCLAPLGKVLLESYGWKGAHFILAALILQGCISSGLMRPLTAKRPKRFTNTSKKEVGEKNFNGKTKSQIEADVKPRDQNDNRGNISQSSHLIGRASKTGKSTEMLATQRLHASAFLTSSGVRDTQSIIHDLRRPMYRKDIFYSGSIYNIAPQKHTESVVSLESAYTEPYERLSCFRKLPKPMADILAEMLDIHVLRNKAMLLLCVANFFGFAGFYVPIVFSTPRAEGLGVSKEKAALLLSVMGICNTIGRVLSGCLSFTPKIPPLLVNNICMALAGLCVLITPFCTTFATMALAIAGYGLFAATFISLASVIICDLVGLEKLTNGFGLICLVRGIAAITCPPLEGYIYDVTGNYNVTFYVGGILLLMSAFFQFLLYLPGVQPKRETEET